MLMMSLEKLNENRSVSSSSLVILVFLTPLCWFAQNVHGKPWEQRRIQASQSFGSVENHIMHWLKYIVYMEASKSQRNALSSFIQTTGA